MGHEDTGRTIADANHLMGNGREHIDVGVVFVCGIGANEAAHRKGLANN
jgi:hypothetical protein